jgi:two-component system phosphate regulon sensor histidine kinase PhoR
MRRSAQRVRQAHDELVATVSHELRTPLTTIIGYVEMLADGDAGALTPSQRVMIEAIDRNARRLQRSVEKLKY